MTTNNVLKFNEAKVYNPLKTLVHCFNAVADTPDVDLNTVARSGRDLYKMITPANDTVSFPIGLSDDDENYLRFQFLTTASKVKGEIMGFSSPETFAFRKSNKLFEELVKQKIVIPANKSGIL